MTVSGGVQAWVTSAVDDKAVDKAIVLAGSLRRVRTAKKLAVFTAFTVSKHLREKLKEVFDLVVLLEQETPNGLSLEDYAKVQGFSLLLFNKCVYVSPYALVLKNCDEIFEKYATFAAYGSDKEVDPTVFVFTPSLDLSRALEKIVHYVDAAGDRARGNFSRYFNLWMQNHIPNSERLEEKYNLRIDLERCAEKSLEVDITIANFNVLHPLAMSGELLSSKVSQLGSVEKYAVEQCLQIYTEDVKNYAHGLQRSLMEKCENEPIAVVGMSFRLPGGNNVEEFWDLLINGREAIQVVPPFRWTREHTSRACKNRTFQGGFLNVPVDEFDAKFFGLSPKEAVFLDPQQRLLHEVSWEAMEDALIDPLTLHGTQTSVFVGSWIHDYKDIAIKSSDVDFFRVYMGNSHASETSRLSHFLGATGPSIATESGCSSAIVALHMACKSLRSQETNLALACGVNLLLHPQDETAFFDFVVSPEGRCKTFDASANGFGRAEACAVLLLKRYSDAVKDGDDIWGLIRGTGVTQEGVSRSLGTPTVHCESLAMELALKEANLNPTDVSYIEAHGTGTIVGDPMEVQAITKAYGRGRGKNDTLIIGSVKTNVGHTEAASGITGIIKVLLSMRNETIPPHLNLETINPEINLAVIPAQIPLSAIPWPRQENKLRIAGVSSFGISGTDGHAIIQEPPILPKTTIDFNQERPLHIMKFSAKCQESLDELLTKYENIFAENEKNESNERDFASMAYSANFGRSTFNHRAVLVANNFSQAAKIIRDKSYRHAEVQSTASNLCFLFTGQGSQYPNMAAKLYGTSPVFKDNFDKCSNVLQQRYGISINEVLWGNSKDGSELSRTLYSQTSIFCVEYCLLKLWESWGVKADYVMGHSLGEFAAAVAAGAITFEDALMLVAERSRLIDSLPRGKMLVIKADKRTVDQTIAKYKESHPQFWVDYAALNSPEQTVVAGDSNFIEEFSKYCGEKKLKSIVLAATHAFHSRTMDPMLEAYRKVALAVKRPAQVNENAPKYISGMEGKLMEASEIDAGYWVRHTREKVNFIDACKVVQGEGCSLFLEVGPHPVLSALAMMNIEGQSVICLPSLRRKEEEWVTILDSLSKLFLSEWKGEIDWKGFDRFYQRQRVALPFYPFNRKPVWIKKRSPLGDLHPLLGKVIPNASGISVFEQDITQKKVDFAQDHVIGTTVVYPGAAFLEMGLVAGHSSVQSFGDNFLHPRRPVVLKGLTIKTPLALFESQLCILQTVVSLDDKDEEEMGYTVNISRLDESDLSSGGQWIHHASAKFLPVAPSLPSEISPVDIANVQETWEKMDTKDFYNKLPEVGLRFGPKFQSLQCGWKNGEEALLVQVKVPQNVPGSYVIHPVIGDAMLQATMLWSNKDNKLKRKLQVPVHIGEFIWLDSSEDTERYIYCSKNSNDLPYSLLMDNSGKPLAYMSSIDFAETTVKLVEGMIHQQSCAMPLLWEEKWISKSGPLQKRLECSCPTTPFSSELKSKLATYNNLNDEDSRLYSTLCVMARHHFLNALYRLGWNPKNGERVTVSSVLESLKIVECHRNYLRFFLTALSNDNLLDKGSDRDTFIISSRLPSLAETDKVIRDIKNSCYFEVPIFKLNLDVGENLTDILIGKSQVLPILFPTDPSKPNAQQFYTSQTRYGLPALMDIFESHNFPWLKSWVEKSVNNNEKPVIRVLEIGSGTGVFSNNVINLFEKHKLAYEYHYTDISAAFFDQAQKANADYLKSIIFKKFNMEVDPFEQGYSPEYFDVILACEVLHISKHLRATLQRLRSLLKPGGLFQFYETVTHDLRINFAFGLLEGYWRFEDYDLRDHATLSVKKWTETLEETGFFNVTSTSLYSSVHSYIISQASFQPVAEPTKYIGAPTKSWIILAADKSDFVDAMTARLEGINRRVYTVFPPENITEEVMKAFLDQAINSARAEVENVEGILYLLGWSQNQSRDQTRISLPLLSVIQAALKMSILPKIAVVTQGAYPCNGYEVSDPTPGPITGLIKTARNENLIIDIFQVDLSRNYSTLEQADETFHNLWSNKIFMSFHDGKRFVPQVSSYKPTNDNLSLPSGCDRFQLQLPESRLISDLEFSYLDHYSLEDNEVEVQIKCMALNFRDVFCVLKPLPIFEKMNAVGLDFAGVVTKIGPKVTKLTVGDRVIGMNMSESLSLPSNIKVEESLVVKLPDSMTFQDGCTLPAVFTTALYCLVNVAKMKKGETLLIHTASGGVGLCAIQLAKKVGVNVIATAGSQRKRNYLRNLGIKHVFNSRTTEFGQQILQVTHSKGVDIVLNSLTGPGFKESSLEALGQNGRFIEMSKLSVWKPEEVRQLRPDVFYEIVDLTSLPKQDFERLTDTLKTFLGQGSVQPIPYERFDALNIRGALNYLQKAKHIGKIVCVMPDVKVEKSKLTVTTPLFNDRSTYLVTGGLGGLGVEVVKWMLESGGKHIAVVSRSKPNSEISAQIDRWNKSGKHVVPFSVDVGNFEQCRELFEKLKDPELGFPQLRGVMHAAGVLSDAIIENQSWEKFGLTFNPKVNGTWNLHDLTKDMALEHFVLFSSVASALGSPGQSNHGAANSFEDALAHYRKSIGLSATSIRWANWGEVGVATEMDVPGVRPISTKQGILALEMLTKVQKNDVLVLNVDSFGTMAKLFPTLKSYIADKRLFGETKLNIIMTSDEFWAKVDAAEGREEKLEMFKTFIKTIVRFTLKLDQDEEIDDNADFQVLGVDSLMMLEMKNGLQNVLGQRIVITAAQMKDCNNTLVLAERLVDLLEGEDTDVVLPTPEELRQLIKEDSMLPEDINRTQGLVPKNVQDIETVLLTGVTGNLGPYLLQNLSHRAQIKKIYCLVRKSGKTSASDRLQARLEKINLLQEINMDKVECVQGDISDVRLGLDEEIYDKLADEVDAIFHSAVRADHTAKYWKAPESKRQNIRSVNVFGTVKVLEFASHTKLKHIYYASTLLSVPILNEEGGVTEDWQDTEAVESFLKHNLGYPLSKLISEILVKQAVVERGIPVKAFRLPVIAGDSRTGRTDFEMNHIVLRWLAYMKLGCMPDIPTPLPLLPVDQCASLSLNVFFNPKADSDVFNVGMRGAGLDQVLMEVSREFNINVEPVPYADFVEKLNQEKDDSPLAPFKKVYQEDVSSIEENLINLGLAQKYVENSWDFFKSRKLLKLYPNYEENVESSSVIMKRDLQYLKDLGVFEKVGII